MLSAKQASGSFLSSLQFTRDALMDFSRGSQRTVNITLEPKKTTRIKVDESVMKTAYPGFATIPSDLIKDSLDPSMRKDLPKNLLTTITYDRGVKQVILVPVKEKVLIKQTKREVYKSRTSPSNKFMKAIKDIELAEANANALGVKYSYSTLAKLKSLVEKAIQSKSYIYARQIVGKIMYLLSTKAKSSSRKKRSSTSEGKAFLQDLRKKVGATKFDSFLAVQGDVGLMFAIDDTGSMGNEIEAAKKIAKDIINYRERKVPIKEYILSPFNDPYPSDPVIVKTETEAGEFEEEIDKLRAHGGGDCPEYTFEGMRGALNNMGEDGSPLYVFTDAGPKDARAADIEEVKMLAKDRGVAINFLTTGSCRSRGYSSHDPRNLHPDFLDLAKSTSGLAIMFNNARELEKVSSLTIGTLDGDATVSTGSTKTSRKKRSSAGLTDSRYSIPVDDSIEKMSVTITTATGGRGIVLKNADNVEITSGKLSLSHITIYEISNPRKGTWTLTVPGSNGDHEFSVKSSSDSNLDFDHYFLITLSWRRRSTEVPVSNPVVGKPLNKIIISVAGSEKLDKSSLRLQLVTTEGKYISDLTLQPQDQGRFLVDFNAHAHGQPFKLKLKGMTQKGYPFERISHKIHKTTTAILRGTYASNYYTLTLGRTTFIRFQLCNFGATETFDFLVAKDTRRYVFRRRLSPKRVIKGRCVYISIFAKATRSEDVGKTDAVFIILKGRISRTVISETVHLLVDN
ncbi:unnamed protein product [Porites lobata]|uniref:Hemicentin-1-like von Willebrand factor A domain-containing protein n=1 Tax=Porites lobata TaxID=104759 RepID=A0ABN8QHB6_9CNID|nr:unnamed protein product [Porites lobata]